MSVTNCFVIQYKIQYEGYQSCGIVGIFRQDVDIKTFKNSFEKNVAYLKYSDNQCIPDTDEEEFTCFEEFMAYYKNSMDTFEEIGYEFSDVSDVSNPGFVECYCNFYHNDNSYLTYNALIGTVRNYLIYWNRNKLEKLEKFLGHDIISVIMEFLIGR